MVNDTAMKAKRIYHSEAVTHRTHTSSDKPLVHGIAQNIQNPNKKPDKCCQASYWRPL